MARVDYVRIHVHDFVLTHFLKKSGWALETAGPLGFREEAVIRSKTLYRLFKEGKAELYIQKDTWKQLVEGKKQAADPKAGLKKQRDGKKKELATVAKRLQKLQAEAQRIASKDPKGAAKLYAEMSRFQQQAAKLKNDLSLLERQIATR